MRFAGFIGPSYQLRSVNVDCQRCINLYLEVDESGHAKSGEVASLVPTPGLSLLATIGAGPIRGVYTASNRRVFAVSGDTLYEIDSNFNATNRGTLATARGPISMADSGNYLAIVDGSTTGKFLKFTDNTFSNIPFPTDIDFIPFAGCDQVVFQDGFFIYINKGTQNFFISGQAGSIVADETTINPLDFSSSEGNPDPLVGMISAHRDLWMFNENSIEVFFNSGNAFPFERIQGAFIEFGCAAKFSIAKLANQIFWLGKDERGQGIVFTASGYQPQRISTHAVENAIQGYGDISDAVAYCYQENGHFFYVLNFTSANTTWVYDTTTGAWHERVYTNLGKFERHRANCHAFGFSKHIVGDYESGNLYELSRSVYSDNGKEIVRQRVTPHVSSGMMRVFYTSLQLDLETGTGLDGIGQGIDPQVMMQFSDDGGHTWSNERWCSIGKIGQTKKRAMWRRLGSSRDRVFKITISDPVKVAIVGAELQLELGAS